METPAKVRQAAQWLTDQYGGAVVYLGEREGAAVYHYRCPEDVDLGFPFVYLLKDTQVTEITGFDALKLIGLYLKD